MSDDAPKKRNWFQIHLSTAIVLMVVAGVLVWANTMPKLQYTFFTRTDGGRLAWMGKPGIEVHYYRQSKQYGWPWMNFLSERDFYTVGDSDEKNWSPTQDNAWFTDYLPLNIAVALAILTAVAVGCEGFIRRREKPRPQPDP